MIKNCGHQDEEEIEANKQLITRIMPINHSSQITQWELKWISCQCGLRSQMNKFARFKLNFYLILP